MAGTSQRTLPLLLITCLGHVLLISAQVQSREGVPALEGAALGAFSGIQRGTSAVADAGRSVWSRYFALSGAARENDALRRRIVELEGELQAERARSMYVDDLEDTLELARSLSAPVLSARVLAGSPAPGSYTILIDRGRNDGVRTDMAVIASAGVVGRVVGEPTASTASVQLLIGDTAANARLEDSGAGGVVRPSGDDPPLRLQWVPNQVAVRVGEQVLTTGQDGVYPQGFLIGTVTRAQGQPGIYQEILVQPAVDFTSLDIVLVVLAAPDAGGGGRP